MDPHVKLYQVRQSCSLIQRGIVGWLINKTTSPLPHQISFVVSMVSQYMAAPRLPHYEAILRIVRHLVICVQRIIKKNSHLHVKAFTDSDQVGSPSDRKSTIGYCSFLGRNRHLFLVVIGRGHIFLMSPSFSSFWQIAIYQNKNVTMST